MIDITYFVYIITTDNESLATWLALRHRVAVMLYFC